MTDRGMVIIGAGEAGARAALELRDLGWNGPVTLVGEEKFPPYERPPLSKQSLTTGVEPEPACVLDQALAAERNIRLVTGARAVGIDRYGHSVTLEDGTKLPYERLLLATGARPRKLALEHSDLSQICYLRTFPDAVALRKRLRPGSHVAVIGGGFIGLEVAASAKELGCAVTLIEAAPRILMRGVPEAIARMVEARHRESGVVMKIGTGLARIRLEDGKSIIQLADGSAVTCDVLVAGIGAMPVTELAAECGLEIENGIKVNERLATSDPDIFGAGDCCSFPHPLYDHRRIRLEAWRNAQDHGMHAAGAMLGSTTAYAAVPWFWSDQYDLTLQVAGLPDLAKITVNRDLGEAGMLYFHLTEEGRLIAASGAGSDAQIAKEIRWAQMLIEHQSYPDLEQLAKPGVKLKSLLPA